MNGRKYTEDDWNTQSALNRNPYYFSKTLAERAAWSFVKKLPEADRFDLVVINVRSSLVADFLSHQMIALCSDWPFSYGRTESQQRFDQADSRRLVRRDSQLCLGDGGCP